MPVSDAIREAFEAIEQSVACGDMSAAQVFTQMKQLISRDSERPGKDSAVQQAQIWAQEARTQKGIVEEIGKLVGCSNDWEMVAAVKAALQSSQTAPAVPEEVREAVSEAIAEALGDAMDCTRVWSAWGVGTMSESDFVEVASDPERVNEIAEAAIMALIAAPQPDHSPDAGKVVQGEPVGWVVERKGDSTFPRFYFDRFRAENMVREVELLPHATMHPVYAHPAESREEIHRLGQQLYDAARFLGCAQAGDNPDAAEHWSLKAEAILARLRASQQEGGEG